MQPSTIELMHDQVRAIYRAMTGEEMPEPEAPEEAELPPSVDEVARRFADLELLARQVPTVVSRVPPFSFEPALDIIGTYNHVLVEVAVPGIKRDDVTVICTGETVVVWGTRGGESAADGRCFHHAEIPRGPFHRVVPLPCSVTKEPRVDVERGLIRIRLDKAPAVTHELPSDREEANNVQGE